MEEINQKLDLLISLQKYMQRDLESLRKEMHEQKEELREEMHEQNEELRKEMHEQNEELRKEELLNELHRLEKKIDTVDNKLDANIIDIGDMFQMVFKAI